jgi:endonuclease/exonuclease/phosphatase family metal-dependent hydrolase
MHGLRDPAGKGDTPERIEQAHRLLNLVTRVMSPEDALVVCGDFNVEPDSRTFDILAGIGLSDLVTSRGFKGTRTSHYGKAGRFADYMLVNGSVDWTEFSVLADPEVSDHCPLVLSL